MAGEYDNEVKKKLGLDVWNLLLKEVNAYRIKKNHMLAVANCLGVVGAHKMRRDDENTRADEIEWRRILSDWYGLKEGGLKQENDRKSAIQTLSNIFSHDDVKLYPLAADLKEMAAKENPSSSDPLLQTVLSPEDLLPPSMTAATAARPQVDLQQWDTCASHAVGKAIQQILDAKNIDADQDKIVSSLKALFPDGTTKARNPNEFKDKEIVIDEKGGKRKFKTHVIINCTLWPKLEPFSEKQDFSVPVLHQFRPGPFFTDEQYQEYKTNIQKKGSHVEMVLRWSLGETANLSLGHLGAVSAHAIYAESYDPATNIFSCINSWGEDKCPRPRIHESRIYAIDLVQCTLKEVTE